MLSLRIKSTSDMQVGTDEQMSKQNNHGCCREYKRKVTPSSTSRRGQEGSQLQQDLLCHCWLWSQGFALCPRVRQ